MNVEAQGPELIGRKDVEATPVDFVIFTISDCAVCHSCASPAPYVSNTHR
jgi:hypothetical protein